MVVMAAWLWLSLTLPLVRKEHSVGQALLLVDPSCLTQVLPSSVSCTEPFQEEASQGRRVSTCSTTSNQGAIYQPLPLRQALLGLLLVGILEYLPAFNPNTQVTEAGGFQ